MRETSYSQVMMSFSSPFEFFAKSALPIDPFPKRHRLVHNDGTQAVIAFRADSPALIKTGQSIFSSVKNEIHDLKFINS